MNVNINGVGFVFKEGLTILEACREEDIYIPTICHLPYQESRAVCRLCSVEVLGSEHLATSCSTKLQNGMDISTNSSKVQKAREVLVNLMLKENQGNLRATSELARTAEILGIKLQGQVSNPEVSFFEDQTSDYIEVKRDACIHCDRCIRSCSHEVIKRKMIDGKLSMDFDGNYFIGDSTCNACGDCVMVCPSGALILKK